MPDLAGEVGLHHLGTAVPEVCGQPPGRDGGHSRPRPSQRNMADNALGVAFGRHARYGAERARIAAALA